MKYTLYSNYCGWIDEEDVKQSLIDYGCVECEEEITDSMVWDEMCFLEKRYWEDISCELKHFFEKGDAWLLMGSIGRWDGNYKIGYIFNTFEEFCRCFKDCDYIEITDDEGHLKIECSHHDGTNFYEVKRVSDFVYEWYNNHEHYIYDKGKVYTKMWNNNFMTSLPHFARDVYGCKE